MFGDLFKTLKAENNNADYNHNRRHERRDRDQCAATVNGQLFPIQNWSMGGALIGADERLFNLQEDVDVTLKFRLGQRVKEISVPAHVARVSRGRVALQFEGLNNSSKRKFQDIISDCITDQFAESQMA